MNIRFQNSKSGIALIVVMIAVFVLSVLAGAFAYSMKVETKLAVNANNQADLEWIGRSGVEYARWILGQTMNCPYDSLNQKWAGGPGGSCDTNGPLADVSLSDVPIGDGSFSIKITDLERKVNVNTADEATLDQVMKVIGADAMEGATIIDSIRDWVDPDDATHINGAESDYYQGLTPPYNAKNGPLDDVSELLLIKGVRDNPEIYSSDYANVQRFDRFGNPVPPKEYAAHLVDVFTAISTGRININTADRIVLQSIPGVDEVIADQIIKIRSGPDGVDGTDDDTPFANVGELASAGLPQTAAPSMQRYCTVRSGTFQVQIDAQIGGSKQTYYAILGRNNQRDIQILGFYPK
ncbi:MAG TPA: general secretion pathway protein GspK [Verrucomicrobiae bacterium]|nr:general secretion pathway protein GspK [Verrucomicrobiae bacterium]